MEELKTSVTPMGHLCLQCVVSPPKVAFMLIVFIFFLFLFVANSDNFVSFFIFSMSNILVILIYLWLLRE